MESLNKLVAQQTISTLQMMGINLESDVEKKAVDTESVEIKIAFTGDIAGDVELFMTKELALKVANVMLCGMTTVEDVDEMTKSTLGEACNMISGSISTILANENISTDIKPPVIELGTGSPNDDFVTLKHEAEGQVINTCFKQE